MKYPVSTYFRHFTLTRPGRGQRGYVHNVHAAAFTARLGRSQRCVRCFITQATFCALLWLRNDLVDGSLIPEVKKHWVTNAFRRLAAWGQENFAPEPPTELDTLASSASHHIALLRLGDRAEVTWQAIQSLQRTRKR